MRPLPSSRRGGVGSVCPWASTRQCPLRTRSFHATTLGACAVGSRRAGSGRWRSLLLALVAVALRHPVRRLPLPPCEGPAARAEGARPGRRSPTRTAAASTTTRCTSARRRSSRSHCRRAAPDGSTLVPGRGYLPKARPRSSSSRSTSRTWSARRRSPPRSRSARRAYKVKIQPARRRSSPAHLPGTPAAKALQPGDIVVGVDGKPVGRRRRARRRRSGRTSPAAIVAPPACGATGRSCPCALQDDPRPAATRSARSSASASRPT